jgi:hypothetical protein
MSVSAKLTVIFFAPPLGVSMGTIVIENYLYDNSGYMNYDFVNSQKNYPSLNAINGEKYYLFIYLF